MKKALALILAVLMLAALFAGCTKDGGGTAAANTPAASSGGSSSGSTASSGGSTASSGEENTDPGLPKAVLEGGEFTFPLTDEKITFTMWQSADPGQAGMTDLNESPAYRIAEEKTNVHWEFFCVSSANASEQFSIAMAGNEYDDMYLNVASYLVNGYDYYIENDIFVDIEPMIPQYAPNFDYVRRLQDSTYISTLTDAGHCPGFWQISQTLQWAWIGPMGRTDWVKEQGLEMPVTYDDFHDMLVVFRDVYNPERPLSIGTNGLVDWLEVGFGTTFNPSSWGAVDANFLNVNGKVESGLLRPGFREYIQMMHDWYAEGLIDPFFYSRDGSMDPAPMLDGRIGVNSGLYCNMDNLEPNAKSMGDMTYEYRGFMPPVKNVGDKREIALNTDQTNYNKFVLCPIATTCENVPVLMRWVDYFYTEEGARLGNYGVEGEAHFVDENGKPWVTDVIYKNPDGIASYSLWQKYMFAMSNPEWYDWEREIQVDASQAVWDTRDLFGGNWEDKYTMPALTPTQAESSEASKIMNDINTYVSENIVRFIIGEKPMSEFDAMLDQCKAIGLERVIEIRQAGLDRYLAR